MTYQVMCSNCGHRSRKVPYGEDGADEIIQAGWNSFGDAFYCKKCVATWEKRNGKDRPLWGASHTRTRMLGRQVGELSREVERLNNRLKKCRDEMGHTTYDYMNWGNEW